MRWSFFFLLFNIPGATSGRVWSGLFLLRFLDFLSASTSLLLFLLSGCRQSFYQISFT